MQGASFIGLVPKKEPKENSEDETEVYAGEDVKPFSDGSTPKEELKEEYGEGEIRQHKLEASFLELFLKREPQDVKKEKVLSGDGVKSLSDAGVPKEEFKEEYSECFIRRQQKQEASFSGLFPKMESKENVKEETEYSGCLVSFKEESKDEYSEEESKRGRSPPASPGRSPPASPFHGFPSPAHAFSLPASRLKRLIEELEKPDPTIQVSSIVL